jgi:predicted Zn-dependent protease
MIDKKQIIKAVEYIKKNCSADDFSFGIYDSDEHLTRFAQNGITQHISGTKQNVRLNVAFDNKTGAASINNLEEASLKYLVETAEMMAKLNQPDPEYVTSEPAQELPEVNNFSKNTAELKTKRIVDDILECVKNAEGRQAKVSGISERHITSNYLMTKNGFEGSDDITFFSHSMTMKKDDVETKVSNSVLDHAKFNMKAQIEQLNTQFESLHKPVELAKGRIPVILRPAAVLQWMFYLIWTFERRNADEGTTPFTDKIGKKFFGDKFTFKSRLDDPDLEAQKYGYGGVPNRNIDWIKNGVIKNMNLDRYYAKKLKKQAARPYNVIVEGGSTSEAEMMKMVDKGVIVNRLWYIRPIDRKTGEWTGLTRDGVLYFENGKVKHSVNNFRWNEILHDATKRILALGPAVQQEYYAKIPAMLIDGFNFVDVTTF